VHTSPLPHLILAFFKVSNVPNVHRQRQGIFNNGVQQSGILTVVEWWNRQFQFGVSSPAVLSVYFWGRHT
jgi:hypothetical protein